MKKISYILVLIFSLVILASCDKEKDIINNDSSHNKQDINQDCYSHTEHTFEYIAYEQTHFKQFTCGCPSPEIVEGHYDNDNDILCDACGYSLKPKEVEFQVGTYYLPYDAFDEPVAITFKEDGFYEYVFLNDEQYLKGSWYIVKDGKIKMGTSAATKNVIFVILENGLLLDREATTSNMWDGRDYDDPVIYFTPGVTEEEILATTIMSAKKMDNLPAIEILSKTLYEGRLISYNVYALMYEADVIDTKWCDKIIGTDYTFTYPDAREILVYCRGLLLTIDEAYNYGYLTLETIGKLNKNFHDCSIGHSYDEGEIVQIPGGGEEILYKCFYCDARKTVALPKDFSFTLTWSFDGYYNSETGLLRNGYNEDLGVKCETTLFLDHLELMNIYRILYNGNFLNIEESFFASDYFFEPSYTIKFSYKLDDKEVSFSIWEASFLTYTEWKINSEFAYAYFKVIKDFIKSSEEYKSLPPNTNLYD